MSTMAPKRKAARCLFGKPDKEAITTQLKTDLQTIYEKDKEKWNFDFESGTPLIGGSGDYHFEAVNPENVPSFYHEKRARARKTRRQETPECSLDSNDVVACGSVSSKNDKKEAPVASTSSGTGSKFEEAEYEKPITRSATRLIIKNQKVMNTEEKGLKQTKLTNYMPVRKRRSETCLVNLSRSVSEVAVVVNEKFSKKSTVLANNDGAPKRPIRFAPCEIVIDSQLSSVSDTVLVASPRSPPVKRLARRKHQTGAGDY